jgi:hypothetical protein
MADNSTNLWDIVDTGFKAFAPIIQNKLSNVVGNGSQQVQDQINFSRINGAGPNNPNLSMNQSPRSVLDLILGSNNDAGQSTTGNISKWIMIAGLAILVVLVFRKR